MINVILSLIKLIDTALDIVESTAEWEVKYNLVFSPNVSGKIHEMLAYLNLHLSYYDPDTSYEDDTIQFANALESLREELAAIANALS